MAKYHVANMLWRICDRAIQVHGALGFSTDTPLEDMMRHARSARLVDGADEVHMQQIARLGLLCFYWRWIREYLGQRFRGASADQAYRRISFEIEAFAAEREETL